ncbi:MAG: uroporphyrinogen-III C-methyltransferase [Planctomycetota bacterium]|nr:MAG: uroporphyrinogen-III C-methyltransferase [Planctomycetota bacterium]
MVGCSSTVDGGGGHPESPMSRTGKVYLVGAGPGDPELISLRAVRCLRKADLVLYDGLVNPLLLRHTRAVAERTCRVIGPHGERLDQQDINRRLIEAARAGKTVVRLKGGDPFVFGRGSEEAEALAEAGVPFEIVPGITAATAVAAYAGIALTHRRYASAVALVTGHEDPGKPGSALDYRILAAFPGTLVFYMALRRVDAICRELIAHGKPAETPAAMIGCGTLPTQQTVVATLEELPQAVARSGLRPPSLLIAGAGVTLREKIGWFERRPLFGLRIGIARAEQQAWEVVEQIVEKGAEPVLLPAIEVGPPEDWSAVDRVLDAVDEYDWIVFTSVNGVEAFLGRLWERGGDWRRLAGCRLAAIGPATAAALERHRLRPDLMPSSYRAEGLADALAPLVPGCRVLWPRASRGRDVLPERLRRAGAAVDTVVVYRNVDVSQWPETIRGRLEQGELDWLCLSSPSIARSVARLLPPTAWEHVRAGRIKVAAISPVTQQAAIEVGLPVTIVAEQYTWPGLLKAIAEAEGRSTE